MGTDESPGTAAAQSPGAPADTIALHGLRAIGYHGVFPDERRDGQAFVVDARLELDLRAAGTSDALADTVSYAGVAQLIESRIGGEPFDLIEALAQRIALDVLAEDARIHAVTIAVHKPAAPLPQDFADVEVRIRRTRADLATAGPATEDPVTAEMPAVTAILALGSNLSVGERTPEGILASAVEQLSTDDGAVGVVGTSPIARTAPVGGPSGQPEYLNMVVAVETTLTPEGLLEHTRAVEDAHGRVRAERWGARTLDVDIIVFGDRSVQTPQLRIPHPRAAERAFVLTPWSWMQPEAVLHGRRVADLAAEAPDAGGLTRYRELRLPGTTGTATGPDRAEQGGGE